MRVPFLPACTAMLLAASGACAADAPAKPNIVFIIADDLGINDLGCYGRKDHKTPHLDKLAAEGMRFTCSYCAQPICSPSRAAILTGKTPARLHLTTYLPGRADVPSQKLLQPKINTQLPLEEITLAEMLKEAGYSTACIGKWHLGGKGPNQHGFDFVHAGNSDTKPSETEGGKGEYGLTRRALQFIEQNKEKPFFLYLAHATPHIPFAAKPRLIEKYRDAFNPAYAAMMESLDDTVGMIVAKLDELKLAEKTIVVFTSDNGGLHVLESPDSPATYNTPFRAGQGFLYEGGLRVPLIVRWPNQVAAGRTVDTPVINTDWTPTFLEFCGRKAPSPLDGMSIAPLLRGGELPPRSLFWHFPHYSEQGNRPGGAIREGDWKLIEHYEDGKLELFNLAQDIGEDHDLAAQESKRASQLKAKLAEWRKAVGAQENRPNPNFDPAWHKRLYEDIDVSMLKPASTAAEMRSTMKEWRAGMYAVLSKMKKSAAP
jgi:arylsulfatase A